ncbi:tRNA(His) guanylyltransferase [Bertholletia excelsa]
MQADWQRVHLCVLDMANSKYEYVKDYEEEDEIMMPNLIVIRIEGRDFHRFSSVHEFEKPNDEQALNLMNSCATAVLEKFPDIVFSYGFNDEYSFVLKKESKFYQRRASKILSLITSFFTSVYVTKWKEYFPQMELKIPPSFQAHVISCPCVEVLQEYLAWRQNCCHVKNQYDTCLWMLIKSGKSEREAQELLEGTQKQEKHELLFQKFGINYKNLPNIFRQGSCVLKTQMEDIVKYNSNGIPIKKMQRKVILVHSRNIASRSFWNGHSFLCKEVGSFEKDVSKVKSEYVKAFQFERKLMPSTWIVIRIDGCHFHGFSEVHEFEKPNDGQALKLMNSCAVAVLEEFHDIVFSYGVSDEYSFVVKKDSHLYQRHASVLVSVIVSFFTSMYVKKWKELFSQTELKDPPYFDGRAVCYPSRKILRDYLAWRQVDYCRSH